MGLLDFITGDNKNGQGDGNPQGQQSTSGQVDYSQVDTNGSQAMPSYGQPASVGQGGGMAGGIPGAVNAAPQAQSYSQSQLAGSTPFGGQPIPQYQQQQEQPVDSSVGGTSVLDSKSQSFATTDPSSNDASAAYGAGTIQDPQNNTYMQNDQQSTQDPSVANDALTDQPNAVGNDQNQKAEETIYGNGELSDIYTNKFPQPQNMDPAQQSAAQSGVVPTPMADPSGNQTPSSDGQIDTSSSQVESPENNQSNENSMSGINAGQNTGQAQCATDRFKPFNLQDFKIPTAGELNLNTNNQQSTPVANQVDLSQGQSGEVSNSSQDQILKTDTAESGAREDESIDMGGSMGSEFGTGTNQPTEVDASQQNNTEVNIGDNSTDEVKADGEENTQDSNQQTPTEDINAQAIQEDITETSLTTEQNTEVGGGDKDENLDMPINQDPETQGEQSGAEGTVETNTDQAAVIDSSQETQVDGNTPQESEVAVDNQVESKTQLNPEDQSQDSDLPEANNPIASGMEVETEVSKVESAPVNAEKFVFSKGVLLGLENIASDYDFTDLVSKITNKNIDLVLDSKEGGGAKILEQLSNLNKKSTSILLKPFHSTDQATPANQQLVDDGGVSFVYSNYFEWLRHIAKEARFFVFFEAGGLKNLSIMSVLWNISEMYEGAHKPIFLMGDGWSDLLSTVKGKFGISDEDSSTLNVINNVDDLLGRLEELNNQFASGGSNVKMQKVVDRRVEGDEKEFMVYSS